MRHYVLLLLFFIFFLVTTSCSTENPPVYQLTTSSNPTEGGTVSPAEGEFDEEEEVNITATPHENWVFEQWQGDHSGNQNPAELMMDSDKNVTALFVKVNYPLTINIDGQGTVIEEIVQEKSTDYPHGTVIKLTAEPAGGWEFDGWQGDIESTENPTMVTIQEETEITAVFTEIEYSLEVNVEGEGTVHEKVVQAKTDYPEGTVVELTAEPEEDWIFSEWNGGLEGSDNPGQITVDSPKEVTATFLRTYTLTTNVSPEEAGNVTPQSGPYVRDTTFDVEAIPASDGWTFVEWEGDFSGSVNPFSMTMNGNKTITANFEKRDFELNTTTEGEGGIEVTLISGKKDGEKYEYQTVLELLAVPEEGWSFLQWKSENISEANPLQVEIDGDKSVTAVFMNKFYIADNGITIKCPNASVGEKSTINNKVYEAVDRELLDQRIEEGADLTKVCTSLVTDMKNLLRDQPDFNQEIGNWDVGNVTDMSYMFYHAELFNQDIGNWNVSSVKDMNNMFVGNPSGPNEQDLYRSNFNQDLNDWDVSNVANMSNMFQAAISFNQKIDNWDVSNVTDMSRMFFHAVLFNQNIGSWDVSSVEDMSNMFEGKNVGNDDDNNRSNFNQDLNAWDVSNVTDMSRMFRRARAFDQDLGNWDVSNVTDMSRMFEFAGSFNNNIGSWDVSGVTDMSGMFYGAYNFNREIDNWDVSNVEDMSGMFVLAYTFDQDIGNWNVSNVTNMSAMFVYASAFNQDIGSWDVSGVTDMSGMFHGAHNYNQEINSWDVNSVRDMSGMFELAYAFNKDIGSWNVSNVNNMSSMFQSASVFNQDIESWDVNNVKDMDRMFNSAESFNQDLSGWCVSNIDNEPTNFDTDASSWVLSRPIWGTCPD